MSTRIEIIRQALRRLGAETGSITSGTATTVVLAELAGSFNDDDWNEATLLMPDAATAADQERAVSDSAGATGTMTIATRADTTYTSETFILMPRDAGVSLNRARNALNDRLAETERTVIVVLPTVEQQRFFSLGGFSWINSDRDVDAVQWRASPNLLDNERFDKWHDGTASAPDSWTLAGAGATVARGSTGAALGDYSATITRSSVDATLTQTVRPYVLHCYQNVVPRTQVTLGAWVLCGTASRARIGISDGPGTTYSSYHTGSGAREFLTVTRTLESAATRLDAVLSVDTGDVSASFDAVFMQPDGAIYEELQDNGSESYIQHDAPYLVRSSEVAPRIEIPSAYGAGQLVVYTRRPFATLSADSTSTECPDDVIVPGLLYELSRVVTPHVDRTRWDRVFQEARNEYMREAARLIKFPQPRSQARLVTRGA